MARAEIGEIVASRSGRPIASASVTVNKRAGGTATVYASETGTTTVANPLTTDSYGRIEGWLNEGSYDLAVTANGSSYTQRFEAIKGGAASSGLVSVTDAAYGADPTGVADSTAAFVAAIAALPATDDTNRFRGGTLVIPPGDYSITASLACAKRVRILGFGAILRPTAAVTGDVLTLTMRESSIEGLTIDGSSTIAGTGNGIRIGPGTGGDAMQQCAIRDVQVWSMRGYGVYWDDGPNLRCDNVYIRSCTLGGFFMSGDYIDNNHGTFTGCHVVGTVGVGYTAKDVTAIAPAQKSCMHTFYNCKAYGIATGVRLETNGNMGDFFLEAITGTPLVLTGTNAQGNSIRILGTTTPTYTESSTSRNKIEFQSAASTSWVSSRRTVIAGPAWGASPIADGIQTSVDVVVSSCAVGDSVTVSGGATASGVLLYATVVSGGSVRVTIYNKSGGNVTPPATLYITLDPKV